MEILRRVLRTMAMRLNGPDDNLRPCGSSRGGMWGLGRGFSESDDNCLHLRKRGNKDN